jgi:hypothetical protein
MGVWDENDADISKFHTPVKFQYVFPKQGPGIKFQGWPVLPTNGTMNFTLHDRRCKYVFMYISGNAQFPSLIAQSEAIAFKSQNRPMAEHIAVVPGESDKMHIMWNQAATTNPTVKFGLAPDKLSSSYQASVDTYKKDDFCDTTVAPAGRQGFFEPGLFLTATVPTKPGILYYYQVCADSENDDDACSVVKNFTAPPLPTTERPTRIMILADLGNAPIDHSLQHSWDFHNHGELPSRNTTRLAHDLLNTAATVDSVVHIGDIAYSVGYLAEWDEFMDQIRPIASRIPWMASIGNHEMGWSASDFTDDGKLRTASDSGGECGVAFLKRFPYAMQPLKPGQQWRDAAAWYSFDIPPVHFTMLSSEHDFRIGSPQNQWMVNDLEKLDRAATPWVIVTSHRPMYIASQYDGDVMISDLLREHVEPAIVKYGVDFFLTGHHHSYQRFCRIVNGTCTENQGPVHYILGMAGYEHSPLGTNPALNFSDNSSYGATMWEFTQTTAKMQFIDGATEKVVDEFTTTKRVADLETVTV